MSSDRARISYDEMQEYRSVVMQQGRVTLEADWNEQSDLLTEEMRKEALDFVGPVGSPDGGYVVSMGEADLEITPGTLYVGGLRVSIGGDRPLLYGNQMKEQRPPAGQWLDHFQSDGRFLTVKRPDKGFELVYLLLREQEITAVEDRALLEVALGGPDTAARKRILQRFGRFGTKQNDCATAVSELVKSLGMSIDLKTRRLRSECRLEVAFKAPAAEAGPCEPASAGGYLGADNQMIRVKTARSAEGAPLLLWGFDNASSLYRVAQNTRDSVSPKTVILSGKPVDSFHNLVQNQAVEVLPAAATLNDKEFAAADHGFVCRVSGYDSATNEVTLDQPLPDVYRSSPRLFLRVWQEMKEITKAPLELGTTGLTVTLYQGASEIHPGDYWCFAVRPGAPTQIFPPRYRRPQLPEGPRLWLCPLALVDWSGKNLPLSCVDHFDNLVDLTRRRQTGCCTVMVNPGDDLVGIVGRYVNGEKVTICLAPGEYELTEPLVLGPEHSNLTIQGCHDGAVLKAAAESEKDGRFMHGLVVLWKTENVTLRQLRFHLPVVPYSGGGRQTPQYKRLAMMFKGSKAATGRLHVSTGVTSVHCAMLTIEECLFRFSIEQRQPVFGIGVHAMSECWGLRISRCRFLKDADYLKRTTFRFETKKVDRTRNLPAGILAGFVLSQLHTRVFENMVDVPAILDDATFEGNHFSGLDAAAIIFHADCGIVRFENNTVRESVIGFFLAQGEPQDGPLTDHKKSAAFPGWLLLFLEQFLAPYPLPGPFAGWLMNRGGQPAAMALEKPNPLAMSLSLHIVNNDIDATISEISESGAAALTLVGDAKAGEGPWRCFSRATINGNTLRADSASVMVADVEKIGRCAITGNVIVNESGGKSISLRVAAEAASVTGNVLGGIPIPLDKLKTMNEIF